MTQFDYESTLQKLMTPEIVRALGDIRELRGRQEARFESSPASLDALVEVAKIQSTGASNRIETIVYLELLRRGYEVTVGRTGDKEIDFVCDKRGEKLYVQVCYLLASDETVNREFGAYDAIRDNFPKYVVSLDELDMSRNGIKHRNIRDFLLAGEWN